MPDEIPTDPPLPNDLRDELAERICSAVPTELAASGGARMYAGREVAARLGPFIASLLDEARREGWRDAALAIDDARAGRRDHPSREYLDGLWLAQQIVQNGGS